ncbi:barstar family protein [Sebaldella sp. S0638]|nr:barstar family protein [Sebaldella sp. S0638]
MLTKNLTWKTGRNLNAFNDILRGGFGVFDDEEIILIWKNSESSEEKLGEGNFKIITDIIKEHDHINFFLK